MTENLPLWLTEDMTWPLLWALLVIGILGFIWFVTRQTRFLLLALVVVGLLIAANVVEVSVVTDKEYLVQSVYEMAEHVRNNNPDGILKFVRDENTSFADRIRGTMSQYMVDGCQIIGFRMANVDPKDHQPRKAIVAFSVLGSGTRSGWPDKLQSIPVAVELEFEQIGGKWTIEDYGYQPTNVTNKIEMFRN